MPASSATQWTTLAALRARCQSAWDKGHLLREVLVPTDAYPRRRPLKHPTARELRDNYPAARQWAGALYESAADFHLDTAVVGRTTIGSNSVPVAAVFRTLQDEIAFLGKNRQMRRFQMLAGQLQQMDPALLAWVSKRPLMLLELGADALTAASVALWFRANPQPGIYLRQLSLPGVHTKFVEAHRRVIDEMVSLLEPDRGYSDAGFAARHGFRTAPDRARFRTLDPRIPLLGAAQDLSVTAEAFSTLELPVHSVIVTENLVNFLALPERAGTLGLFGAGYGFAALNDAAWLRRCDVFYWGDIDTHGFRILDQLRASHPHVHSILMDVETLLEHRPFWGTEPKPTHGRLTRLTPEEADVYAALCDDTYGPAVRLEQEHIDWNWALEKLSPEAAR